MRRLLAEARCPRFSYRNRLHMFGVLETDLPPKGIDAPNILFMKGVGLLFSFVPHSPSGLTLFKVFQT